MKIVYDKQQPYDVDPIDRFEIIFKPKNKSIFLVKNKDGENMYLIPSREPSSNSYTIIPQNIIRKILKTTAIGILDTEEQVCQLYYLCGCKVDILALFISIHKSVDKLYFDTIIQLYIPNECIVFEEKTGLILEEH